MLVPLELKCKEPEGDRVVYTGIYDTEGVAPTKSGERQPIQITMPVSPRLEVWGCGFRSNGNCRGKKITTSLRIRKDALEPVTMAIGFSFPRGSMRE